MKYVWITLAVLVGLVALIALVGAFLPVAHQVARKVVLPLPAKAVFAAVTDVDAYPKWAPGIRSVQWLPDRSGRRVFREVGPHGRVEHEQQGTAAVDDQGSELQRFEGPGGSDVGRLGNADCLHHRQAEARLDRGGPLRRFMAVKLQHVELGLGEDRRNDTVVGIDDQADLDDMGRDKLSQRTGERRRHAARAFGIEVEAKHHGAALDRGIDGCRRLQPADLHINAHHTVSETKRG